MTDKESAVMDELWRTVNSQRFYLGCGLAVIEKYREWLPSCVDRETKTYYVKWLDYLEKQAHSDNAAAEQHTRAQKLQIERPPR